MTEDPTALQGAGVIVGDCALPSPSRHLQRADVRVQWRWLGAERAVCGELWFGADGEGLPGHIHGGLLAAVCDEAMGWTCWMSGYIAPGTATQFNYLSAVRGGDKLTLRAWVSAVDGRKVATRADLMRADTLVVTARGDYTAIRPRDLALFDGWPGLERFADPAWLARWPLRGTGPTVQGVGESTRTDLHAATARSK